MFYFAPLVLLLNIIVPNLEHVDSAPNSSQGSGSLAPQNSLLKKPSSSANDSQLAPNPLGDALKLYRKGDLKAAAAYQRILEDKPKSPDAHAGLVRVYLKLKKFDLAAQETEKGLALTNSPRIRVARGELWFRQGKIDEAEREWVGVVNSGFPEARAYLGIARVHEARAMYKSAQKMIAKALELDPHDPDVQSLWLDTLTKAERIQYLERLIADESGMVAADREALKII